MDCDPGSLSLESSREGSVALFQAMMRALQRRGRELLNVNQTRWISIIRAAFNGTLPCQACGNLVGSGWQLKGPVEAKQGIFGTIRCSSCWKATP